MTQSQIDERFQMDGPTKRITESRGKADAGVLARVHDLASWMNEHLDDSRELSMAVTKLEEALLWFERGVEKQL